MIRVEITAIHLDPIKHDVSIGAAIVGALREACIPIEASVFVLRGVSRGILSYSKSGYKHLFEFCESNEGKDVSSNPFTRTYSHKGVEIFKNGQHLAEDDEL